MCKEFVKFMYCLVEVPHIGYSSFYSRNYIENTGPRCKAENTTWPCIKWGPFLLEKKSGAWGSSGLYQVVWHRCDI
jgi:hypothetical protein